MSAHKNTLKTAFNDVTGDTIRTGKGSQEKYAANWDAIFKPKKKVEEHSWALANGTVITFKGDWGGHGEWSSVGGPMYFAVDDSCVEPTMVPDPPSAVMALDFHDSQPKQFFYEATQGYESSFIRDMLEGESCGLCSE